MHKTDYLIVGGGIIGMLVAHELAQAGKQVMLLERGQLGGESSWAGGGILSPLYPWRYSDAINALSHWGQQQYPFLSQTLQKISKIDSQWVQSGLLILNTHAEQSTAKYWAERIGSSLQSISENAVSELEPQLCELTEAALYLPNIAQIRPSRLVQALQYALDVAGVKLCEQTEVTGFTLQNDKIVAVKTQRGPIFSPQVVIAGGAWSAQLLASIGVKLPIEPVRGQMIVLRGAPGLVSNVVLNQDHYLIPRLEGRILVGSTKEYVGFDKRTTEAAKNELFAAAIEMMPALAKLPVEYHWAGLRPGNLNNEPFIGEHPGISGLFINTGHFRNGVVLGPASARLLVDGMLGREPIVDPTPYKIPSSHQIEAVIP